MHSDKSSPSVSPTEMTITTCYLTPHHLKAKTYTSNQHPRAKWNFPFHIEFSLTLTNQKWIQHNLSSRLQRTWYDTDKPSLTSAYLQTSSSAYLSIWGHRPHTLPTPLPRSQCWQGHIHKDSGHPIQHWFGGGPGRGVYAEYFVLWWLVQALGH